MFVGVLRISLHLQGNGSLKGKRRIMRAVIERTRAKFNASVAEVADNDLHQRGVVGVSVVGNRASHVDAMLGNIGRYIEQLGLAPVGSIETEVIPLGGDIGDAAARSICQEPATDGEPLGGLGSEEEEW
jgi:uncharacterized protein YlxP (DUF503 family)